MERIVAAFKNKLESIKSERNIKRISRSIETAKDNALDAIEDLEAKKAELVEKLPTCSDYKVFIQELSDLIGEQETQQTIVSRLEEIEKYLKEDVKVDEK